MAQQRVHILVADPSLIIRGGVVSVLLNLESLRIDVAEVSDMMRLGEEITYFAPEIVIVNPKYLGVASPRDLCRDPKSIKYIALSDSTLWGEILNNYDAAISVMDSAESIEQTLTKLMTNESVEQVELSQREKEIVVAVAKGMSNREVADMLFISTNTVMTHRRNIAAKLDIRNPAGLTIYAIVNGLIDISEVK